MEAQAGRLGRKSLYLPGSFDYDEIRKQLKQLTDALGLPELTEDELAREQESCEEALAKSKKNLIGGYAGHSGLSVSSKTTWTGKTASDTWLFCVKSCLSGQYQSGRKSRFFFSGCRSMHRNLS